MNILFLKPMDKSFNVVVNADKLPERNNKKMLVCIKATGLLFIALFLKKNLQTSYIGIADCNVKINKLVKNCRNTFFLKLFECIFVFIKSFHVIELYHSEKYCYIPSLRKKYCSNQTNYCRMLKLCQFGRKQGKTLP